jgi:formylglycine-generating enzyme required for sulfatase activity
MSGAFLVALGPALAKALYEVGKEVVAKPLLEPATGQLKERLLCGYRARPDDAKVIKAVEAALAATGFDQSREMAYPLQRALHNLGEGERDTLRQATVAAALAMTEEVPEQVPDELLGALDVGERHRPVLARFLWAFRRALVAADEDYRALAELAHHDAAREYLRSLALTVVQTHEGPAQRVILVGPEEREIEARYLRSLVELECRFLPLGGRDPRASTTTGLPMHLERVYIALNTTERPPEARGMKSDFGEIARALELENSSALSAVADHSRLVLLGHPGSGKTTFADHLALCLAGERLEPGAGWFGCLETHDAAWEGPALLPIRLRLRDFAADVGCLPASSEEGGRAEHLLAYIEKRLREARYGANLPDHALACLLDRGDALLVLDGLDEVGGPSRREQVARAIVDLAQRRCSRAHLLVTCRVRQYPLDTAGCPIVAWALPGFHIATLADFDRGQIARFIDAWFDELCELGRFSRELRDRKAASLKEAISVRPDLQEIAPRPILLTQMALVHDIEGELPGTRVQLYAGCADLLLWKWEQLRAERAGLRMTAESFIRERMDVPGLQKEDLQRALDHAVYDAHSEQGDAGEGPADIPEDVLQQRLCRCLVRTGLTDPDALSKAQFFIDEYLRRRNGLIIPSGERSFQTPHRSFQEFLAARWLQSQRRFDREAPRLVRENYDLWREVFLLAVGQVEVCYAVDAIDVLCSSQWPNELEGWRQLILAGQGLNEVGLPKVRSDEKGPEVERRVIRFLERVMQDVGPDGLPNDPPLVPVPTRYAAGETLDRLGWLPDDLDDWVEVEIPNPNPQTPSPKPQTPNPKSQISSLIYMARYAVTNGQFARFIAAGGYEERGRRWWSDEGWEYHIKKHPSYRGEEPVTQPEYWNDPRLGKGRRGYPVVGICWYEAMAYCRWLTEQYRVCGTKFRVWREGKSETLNLEPGTLTMRLPTEAEWVAAAGGEDEERYPWGTDWDESRANTREGRIGGTTPVGMYPSGQSPAGVWDMGGNVWEWTASRVGEREVYALRGGSWYDDQELARVAERLRFNPDLSHYLFGFRVVGSPASPGS